MGGNLSLLYLGKQADSLPDRIRGAVVFSVPCDLADSARQLDRRSNAIYMHKFLTSLHLKIKAKQHRFPEALDDTNFRKIKTFGQFDSRYTAPIHGFKDARDYWSQCSSKPWLECIKVPCLIVNAADDPFLAGGCYPVKECGRNARLTLAIPRYGGHVGFVAFNGNGRYWSEERALQFLQRLAG